MCRDESKNSQKEDDEKAWRWRKQLLPQNGVVFCLSASRLCQKTPRLDLSVLSSLSVDYVTHHSMKNIALLDFFWCLPEWIHGNCSIFWNRKTILRRDWGDSQEHNFMDFDGIFLAASLSWGVGAQFSEKRKGLASQNDVVSQKKMTSCYRKEDERRRFKGGWFVTLNGEY